MTLVAVTISFTAVFYLWYNNDMKIHLTVTQWIGLGLIVLATSFIPLLAVVPFLELTLKQKAFITSFLIIGGQVITWIGGILLGKELLMRYRQHLNPRRWFRKK